jgi:hypothetical protein
MFDVSYAFKCLIFNVYLPTPRLNTGGMKERSSHSISRLWNMVSGQIQAPAALPPEENAGFRGIRVWLDHRVGMAISETIKIRFLAEIRTHDLPAPGPITILTNLSESSKFHDSQSIY